MDSVAYVRTYINKSATIPQFAYDLAMLLRNKPEIIVPPDKIADKLRVIGALLHEGDWHRNPMI
jgi:hypothetical protein